MALADDLLEQAEGLAKKDAKRPKQANLRRSISSAYYALYHLLTAEAGSVVASNRTLRPLVQRAFQHATMKQACKSFGGGTLPGFIRPVAPSGVSSALRTVANTFIELQQARHEADYKVDRRFLRTEVTVLLNRTRHAFKTWQSVNGQEKDLFLVSLLLWKQWEHLR